MPFSTQEIQPITISMDLFGQPGQPIIVQAYGSSGEEFGDDFWSFNIAGLDLGAPIHGTLRVTAALREERISAVQEWFTQGCQRFGLAVVGFRDEGSWFEDESDGPSILMMFTVTKNW